MNEDVSPFRLTEYGDGKKHRFGLLLVDLWPGGDAFFEKHGEYVNGHTWAKIIRALVDRDTPALASALHYDPESEMCVVRSDDRAALLAIARLVRELRADQHALDAAVESAQKHD